MATIRILPQAAASVNTPPTGYFTLFLDSSNSDLLSIKDDTGAVSIIAGGSSALVSVLVVGNVTGGTDVVISAGDFLTVTDATASTIAGFDASKGLVTLPTGTYPSLAELAYVKGVTSSIQTQIDQQKESIGAACSDETTALTTGTAKVTFRMPFAMTLTDVRASLTGAGSASGTTTVDINKNGTTVLSTKLTIDFGEKTSTTAATPAVISDSALADDAEITVDIDAVTGGADETGLKIWLIGTRS